jgi:alpha-L-fucosidase 2
MKISRREMLEAGLAGALAASAGRAGAQAPAPAQAGPVDPRTSLIWHNKPAATWPEADPVGNGRLGAMVFGNIKRERIQLNEDRFWSGSPYSNVNPEAREALPRVRELIFAGRYAEAEAFAEAHVQAVPMREMSYQSLGDLWLDLVDVDETSVEDYRRELDLDAATSRVRFVSNGVAYVRETFSSPVDQVIAIQVRAEGGPLALDCAFSSGQRASATIEGGATLVLAGVNNKDRGIAGKLRFEMRARIVADGGTVTRDGAVIQVRGARSILILLAAATSFRSPVDVSGDAHAIAAAQLAAAAAKPFERLREDHLAEHRRLFRRVAIDLGGNARAEQPTDQRAGHAIDRDDPALAALFFQFGRYLLISASRRGSEPANLQGIWNESNRPPWGSKYTININTEMNYWPADPANLAECFEPLVAMVEELAISGAHTARDMYGARGWVAHHNTDLWRASGPVDHVRTGLWPTGAAWLSCQLWDHYDFHRDPAYLRRIYPLLRGASLFFLDTLVKDPATGHMVTNPSLSPENDHGRGSTLCAGPALDMQLLRDLFDRTIASSRLLKRDSKLRPELGAMRARLAPHQIGKAGQLQEWLADWDLEVPEPTHRHTSHLYAVYPIHQINLDETPDLARAARKSMELRGPEASGWALGWRTNIWARLRDAEHAHLMLRKLLQTEPNYPGWLGVHPPFQIDCFFGGTAGIAEMLVQSRDSLVDLLPALPAAWPTGSVRGLRIRGACAIDLAWRDGKLDTVTLHPEQDGARTLRSGDRRAEVRLKAGRALALRLADFA